MDPRGLASSSALNAFTWFVSAFRMHFAVRLGQVYRKGRWVEKDLRKAFQLILDAAQQEHVRAEHVLGSHWPVGAFWALLVMHASLGLDL